jgi:methyl-accepting chemotaxis protein
MKNLKIGSRIALSLAIFMLPLSYLLYSYYDSQTANINFALKEKAGLVHMRPGIDTLDALLAQYEARVKLDKGKTTDTEVSALAAATDKAFTAYGEATKLLENELSLSHDGLKEWERSNLEFSGITAKWEAIKQSPATATPEQYDALITDIRALISHAGDASNLVLDPDLDSYYLMDAVVFAVPSGIARVYEAERYAFKLHSENRTLTDEEKAKLQTYASMLMENDVGRTGGDMQTSYTKDALFYGVSESYKASTEAKLADYAKSHEAFSVLLTEWVKGKTPSLEALNQSTDQASAAAKIFWHAAANELDIMLTTRADVITGVRNLTLLISAGFIVFAFLIFGWIVRNIVRSLKKLQDAMVEISDGRLDYPVPCLELRDEIGNMARTLQIFQQTSIEARKMEEEQQDEQQKKLARQHRVDELIKAFDTKVSNMLATVSQSASSMEQAAKQMAHMSDEASNKSGHTQRLTAETTDNIGAVAAASEELSAAINEISRQVARSTVVTNDAVSKSREADGNVVKLTEAANRIGEVITLINDIAGQINLLALNATIESARAGEAGKGFAVVANEVKHLAGQTSKATETIAGQITDMQQMVGLVVQSLNQIRGTVDEVNNISTTIAAAVEEQGAATREIAENIQRTADRVQQVSSNVSEVRNMATATNEGARSVTNSAQEFSNQSRTLQSEVEGFLGDISRA